MSLLKSLIAAYDGMSHSDDDDDDEAVVQLDAMSALFTEQALPRSADPAIAAP